MPSLDFDKVYYGQTTYGYMAKDTINNNNMNSDVILLNLKYLLYVKIEINENYIYIMYLVYGEFINVEIVMI